jgi:hypothetical protein
VEVRALLGDDGVQRDKSRTMIQVGLLIALSMATQWAVPQVVGLCVRPNFPSRQPFVVASNSITGTKVSIEP